MDGRTDVAAYLTRETKAQQNRRDALGRTPLHWAAIRDDGSAAEALLRSSAKHRLVDDDGDTPMKLAMTHGSMDFVCAFLRAAM